MTALFCKLTIIYCLNALFIKSFWNPIDIPLIMMNIVAVIFIIFIIFIILPYLWWLMWCGWSMWFSFFDFYICFVMKWLRIRSFIDDDNIASYYFSGGSTANHIFDELGAGYVFQNTVTGKADIIKLDFINPETVF